jgi:hypothetical protein
MGNEIKNLLDDITKDVDASYNPTEGPGITFDKGAFREKLSLYVLKDIVCAMLDENIDDVDEMVDKSIMKHIHDNYDGSCYGYLCHARDRLASPGMNVFGNIVQEIDEKCKAACESACVNKQVQEAAVSDAKELLDGVENYDQLREKLKKEVSQQVVNDVVKVITKSSEAPVFDIDDKVKVVDNPEPAINPNGTKDSEDDVTTESFILKRIGGIITEGAIAGETISQEEAYDTAIVEYAIAQMDVMTKARPKFLNTFTKFM